MENVRDAALGPMQRDQLTATGFLRMAPDGTQNPVDDLKLARNQVIAEEIKVVSSSLLGLTIGCAQRHDHRYDPTGDGHSQTLSLAMSLHALPRTTPHENF
jgi:hypothetical protein